MATVLGQYARGVALARTRQPARAAEALAALEPAAARLVGAHASNGDVDRMLRGLALVARERLRAEVAFSEGRADAALAHQTQALAVGKDIDAAEPPLLAAGTRLALGDMQLQARRWAAAEQSFRVDLAAHPRSGWALRGLTKALRAQGRDAEACAVRARLRRDWSAADAGLMRLD